MLLRQGDTKEHGNEHRAHLRMPTRGSICRTHPLPRHRAQMGLPGSSFHPGMPVNSKELQPCTLRHSLLAEDVLQMLMLLKGSSLHLHHKGS